MILISDQECFHYVKYDGIAAITSVKSFHVPLGSIILIHFAGLNVYLNWTFKCNARVCHCRGSEFTAHYTSQNLFKFYLWCCINSCVPLIAIYAQVNKIRQADQQRIMSKASCTIDVNINMVIPWENSLIYKLIVMQLVLFSFHMPVYNWCSFMSSFCHISFKMREFEDCGQR